MLSLYSYDHNSTNYTYHFIILFCLITARNYLTLLLLFIKSASLVKTVIPSMNDSS